MVPGTIKGNDALGIQAPPTENDFMKRKYYVFRRWLDTRRPSSENIDDWFLGMVEDPLRKAE